MKKKKGTRSISLEILRCVGYTEAVSVTMTFSGLCFIHKHAGIKHGDNWRSQWHKCTSIECQLQHKWYQRLFPSHGHRGGNLHILMALSACKHQITALEGVVLVPAAQSFDVSYHNLNGTLP